MTSLRTASLALSVLLAVGASGCVQQRVLTPEQASAEREQTARMTTRVYPDKKPEEVIKAADYIFRLADHDYEFAPTPTGFQAHRQWWVYFVIGNQIGDDWWQVNVTPEGSGSKIYVMHSASEGGGAISPIATHGGSMYTNVTTKPGLYNLFYSRLEHILYGRGEWVDCKRAKTMFADKSIDPFCKCSDDNLPAMTPKNATQK